MEDETKTTEVSEQPVTAFGRLRSTVEAPDFSVPELKSLQDVMLEYPMPLNKELAHKMVDMSGIQKDAGEQSAVAVENFLSDIGGFGDKVNLSIGQILDKTGEPIGKKLLESGYKAMNQRLEDASYREDMVGGIRSDIANLVSGGLSMAEYIALGSIPYLGTAVMATDVMGSSVYKDLEAYKEENGSLYGYHTDDKELAFNLLNTIGQTAIEKFIGVGNPRFLQGAFKGSLGSAVKKGALEAGSGFLQESSQSALDEVNEWLKGHQEWQDVVEKSNQYIYDGVMGALLQGTVGGAVHFNGRLKAQKGVAEVIAKANGREVPNKEDNQKATKYVDNQESGIATAVTEELANKADEQTAGDKTPEQVEQTITNIGRQLNEKGISTATEKDGVVTVNMVDNEKGTIETEIYVDESQAEGSQFYTPESEFKTESKKKSASKVQQTLKGQFGDKVNVDKLKKMDTKATIQKATDRINQNKQSVIDLLNDENANKLDRATAYHALAQQILDENDIDLLNTLADENIAKFGRELGQAVAMLDIKNDTGFNVIEVARDMKRAKGTMTEQQFNDEVAKIGVEKVVLSDNNIKELKQSTECEL